MTRSLEVEVSTNGRVRHGIVEIGAVALEEAHGDDILWSEQRSDRRTIDGRSTGRYSFTALSI